MPANTALGYPYPLGTDKINDGDATLAALATKVDTAKGIAARGSVTINVAAINTTYAAAVTFPVGLFTVAPVAVMQPQTGAPQDVFGSLQTQPTTTGVNLCVRRTAGTGNLLVHWVAIQQAA